MNGTMWKAVFETILESNVLGIDYTKYLLNTLKFLRRKRREWLPKFPEPEADV